MKKNIAIVAGGNSSEVVVSLKSAAGLYSFMDKERYQLYIVTIVGCQWQVELSENEKKKGIGWNIDNSGFSFSHNGKTIQFDFAYITIHGTPGEDGILQGYFDLLGIPYSTCGVLTSAITFNKFTCNQYLKGFGVRVSDALLLREGKTISDDEVVSSIGFPCFFFNTSISSRRQVLFLV